MEDFDLELSHELEAYGIGYIQSSDAHYIGPRYWRGPKIAHTVIAHEAPSRVLTLHYIEDSRPVGVVYGSVGYLIACYLNGKIPESFPLTLMADLADFFLNDRDSIAADLDEARLRQARCMHDDARGLLRELEYIPAEILKRIWDAHSYPSCLIN